MLVTMDGSIKSTFKLQIYSHCCETDLRLLISAVSKSRTNWTAVQLWPANRSSTVYILITKLYNILFNCGGGGGIQEEF